MNNKTYNLIYLKKNKQNQENYPNFIIAKDHNQIWFEGEKNRKKNNWIKFKFTVALNNTYIAQ